MINLHDIEPEIKPSKKLYGANGNLYIAGHDGTYIVGSGIQWDFNRTTTTVDHTVFGDIRRDYYVDLPTNFDWITVTHD